MSSIELEHAILKHPAIARIAVHAIPSEFSGDEIKACLVLNPNESLSPEELFNYFKISLPYFAIPRYVEILGELPMNNMRVQKFKLHERGVTDNTWDFEELGLVVEHHERRSASKQSLV